MKKRVLYVCRRSAVHFFKEFDYRVLSERYEVERVHFTFTPWCLWRMFWALRRCDAAFCWFGNVWAFFAVLFAKVWRVRTVIVAGGHDVACVPEIRYGLRQMLVVKHMARWAFRHADLVLPVSQTAETRLLSFAPPRRHTMIYNAVELPAVDANLRKHPQVLTVGMVNELSSRVKGHQLFIAVARHLPDVPFVLYGQQKDDTVADLRRAAPPNVQFVDHVDRKRLYGLYAESSVYAQLSYDESFGVAVVEAMAHGCTPVVTKAGALPEVVADCGEIVASRDAVEIAGRIRSVLERGVTPNERAMARAREFPPERRQRELLAVMETLWE